MGQHPSPGVWLADLEEGDVWGSHVLLRRADGVADGDQLTVGVLQALGDHLRLQLHLGLQSAQACRFFFSQELPQRLKLPFDVLLRVLRLRLEETLFGSLFPARCHVIMMEGGMRVRVSCVWDAGTLICEPMCS